VTPPRRLSTPSPATRRAERVLRAAVALAALVASAALWWPVDARAARIKDVAAVQGVRANQLIGYGLVVGLDGSGDQSTQTPYTTQSLNNLLQQLGITLPPGVTLQPKNVASVMVTASLPPFAQPGQAIDVNVSSMGNAKSLRGGQLISTPLLGADGQVYALAQGGVVVGGAGAQAAGSKVQINSLNSGRIPRGATVERAASTTLHGSDWVQLDLNAFDFSTARAVAQVINRAKGEGSAQALDARAVRVRLPAEPGARVAFLADIENLPLELEKPAARVVIDSRNGSVVVNGEVKLGACAIAHGSLQVTITNTPQVSQPNAFAAGRTVVTEQADITVTQQPGALIQLPPSAQLADVVKALNTLGATPQDLMSILQAMKAAGALNAEIEVI
jgi:flagellar P-ring protein precursor FlgI